ncbi:MAG: hypothetical protein M0Z99_19180 [Betaproteobacteria bacterium]|nr:hypothetical protein [Betaproteobacteria bacterium]
MASGYVDLDRLTSGFQRGDLVVVAGRPGMKRTELTLGIAEYVGVDLALPVLIFTHDVSAQQFAVRAIASRARVDLNKLHSGRLADDEEERLRKGLECLCISPVSAQGTLLPLMDSGWWLSTAPIIFSSPASS